MSLLKARDEAGLRRTLRPGQVLVPYDHITSIRISFYSLRLAKSDVFTPKLWEYKWIVDEHIRSLTEDSGEFSLNSSLASSLQTSGNNLTLLDRKFQSKDSDWDSGFSDGQTLTSGDLGVTIMSSSSGIRAIRQARRKKSSLSEVKIAVVGAPGVGKSALVVRFLTKRYIGEYDHQSDTRYKNEVLVDGDPVIFEICDLCPRSIEDLPSTESLGWADGVVLVYSITERSSFNFIKQVWNIFQEVKSNQSKEVPLVLLGNKGDMVHLRQVSSEEGDILAKDFDCNFREVAAADQVNEIADAFHDLCRDVHVARRKNKPSSSLLDRVYRAYHRGKSDSSLSKD